MLFLKSILTISSPGARFEPLHKCSISHAIAASLQGFISLKAFIFPLTICHPISRADEKDDHLTGALLV